MFFRATVNLVAVVAALVLCLYPIASSAQPPPNCNLVLDNDGYQSPTGLPVAWAPEDIPVPYYINPSNYPAIVSDPNFLLIKNAFARWQRETLGALVFCYAGTTGVAGLHFDFQNTISFGDPEDDVACPSVASTVLVASSETFTNRNGVLCARIVDADIVFNDESEGFFSWGDDSDLATCDPNSDYSCASGNTGILEIGRTAAHEIGHFLGLDHTNGTIMDAGAPYCDPLGGQIIGEDVACLTYLYPHLVSLPGLVVACGLSLSPSGPYFVGERLAVRTVVVNTTNADIALEALAVTGRHQDGSVWDFPLHRTLLIEEGGQYVYEDHIVLGLPGQYSFEVSHRIGSSWYQTPALAGVTTTASISVSPMQPFFAGIHREAGNHYVFIYPCRGDGTFQQEERIADFDSGAAEIRALAIADYNHDGLYDVFAALLDGRCFYLRNEGAIVFTPVPVATLSHSVSRGCATAGDFTGDGRADVLVAAGNGSSQTFYLIEQLGDAPAITITPMPGPAHDAGNYDSKVVDAEYVDSDAVLDIVVNGYDNDDTQAVDLYRGNGDGSFQAAERITDDPPGTQGTVAMTLGDFNGDRKVDLIMGMDDDGDPGQAWGCAGNGDGTFTLDWVRAFDVNPLRESGTNYLGTGECDAFDFDSDGRLDIVAIAVGLPGQLFLGTGALAFSDSLTIYQAVGSTRGCVAAPDRAPVGPTEIGRNVTTYLAGYAITAFDSVITRGATSLLVKDPATGPHAGTRLAVLEIVTTATFVDGLSLALPYAQYLPAHPGVQESSLRLYQSSGSGWLEVPCFLDSANQVMHARVTSLASFAIVGDNVTGVTPPDGSELPAAFSLRCQPNPFNPLTTLHFDLPVGGRVRLEVYDVAGRLVRTLLDTALPAGSHQAVWDGKDAADRGMPSGSYFARLSASGKVETVRMGLVR